MGFKENRQIYMLMNFCELEIDEDYERETIECSNCKKIDGTEYDDYQTAKALFELGWGIINNKPYCENCKNDYSKILTENTIKQTIKNKLIKRIVDVAYKAKEGHIPSSLSILDILYVLYNTVLKENPDNKFILSKGHASLGLYAILEHFNLLEDNLDTFCQFNSKLGGHPTNKIKNVTASTGSLGHGLPIAVGMAMAEKIKESNNKIYCVIGDGETNEGTIWESALLAANHKLDNLVVILDYNHSNDRALDLGDIEGKFNSFGWKTIRMDGHNTYDIEISLTAIAHRPIVLIADTIKGKGIKMMENNHEWHHKNPNEEEYNKIMEELK